MKRKNRMAFIIVPLLAAVMGLSVLLPFAYRSILAHPYAAPVAAMSDGGSKTEDKADFLSPTEKAILDEINQVRAEPQKYAAYLEELKKYYKGKQLARPGQPALMTMEGLAAVDEAITALRAAKPLPLLLPSKGLCLAAKDHAVDMSKSGIDGHRGSDGSIPDDRVARYGQWQTAVGEAIIYKFQAARDVVLGMLIDDGVPSRGHRNNILNASFRVVGVNVGSPNSSGAMGVVNYAGGFVEKAAGNSAKPTALRKF